MLLEQQISETQLLSPALPLCQEITETQSLHTIQNNQWQEILENHSTLTNMIQQNNTWSEISETPLNLQLIPQPLTGNGRDCIYFGCMNKKGTGPKRASFNVVGECHAIYCEQHKSEEMVNVNNKKCEKCNTVPNFNYPDQKPARFCAKHAKDYPGMVNVNKPPCEWEGCTLLPSYGFPEEKKLRFCSKHGKEQEGAVNLKHKKCEKPGCGTIPVFNYPDQIAGRFCANHAKEYPGMVNVISPICQETDCTIRASYNLPGLKELLFCEKHAVKGMINLRRCTCIIEGCPGSRIYNFINVPNPLYCRNHKADNMIDQVTKKCEYQGGCTVTASFNLIGQKRPKFCKRHKTSQMIDVKHGTCLNSDCTLQPGFNFPGEKKPIYCSQHQKPGMIDLKHKYCLDPGCLNLASFNVPSEKSRLYCEEHKTYNMVNLSAQSCQKCNTSAKFNYPGETTRLYCSADALPRMVDLDKKITCCIQDECTNLPLFNSPYKKAIYCDIHKKENMVNLEEEKICSHEGCSNLPIASLNDLFYCSSHYPDQSAISLMKGECSICDLAPNNYVCKDCKSKQHQKECTTVCYLKRKINQKPILDSNLPVRECSKRRPDIYYECLKHIVIVEVDEDQHKRYQPQCECARISQIVSSIGGKSVTFVRYNPDKITNNGQEVVVAKTERLERLVQVVKDELNNGPEGFQVKLIQLYYNDDYANYQPYKTEDITELVAV